MKRIRIGKDISMRWEITTDGVAIPLDGRDLTVEIKSPMGIENNIPYRVEGNILIMTYYGYEQKRTGEYSITLWEKKGKPGQNVVDVIRAFKLVETSQEEDDFVGGDLQIESVDLGTENFDILTEGGYRAINIDTLQAEALEDSVNINGKTYSNESFTITLPKANLDSAGVMGASDVRTLKEHADSIAQINTTLEEHNERINAKITTDRIENGAVTSEKIATSAFDSTLSVSGKISPADVVGEKLTELMYYTTNNTINSVIRKMIITESVPKAEKIRLFANGDALILQLRSADSTLLCSQKISSGKNDLKPYSSDVTINGTIELYEGYEVNDFSSQKDGSITSKATNADTIENLEEFEAVKKEIAKGVYENGLITSSGEIDDDSHCRTFLIPCEKGDIVKGYIYRIKVYGENAEYLGEEGSSFGGKDNIAHVITTEGAKYARFIILSANITKPYITVNDIGIQYLVNKTTINLCIENTQTNKRYKDSIDALEDFSIPLKSKQEPVNAINGFIVDDNSELRNIGLNKLVIGSFKPVYNDIAFRRLQTKNIVKMDSYAISNNRNYLSIYVSKSDLEKAGADFNGNVIVSLKYNMLKDSAYVVPQGWVVLKYADGDKTIFDANTDVLINQNGSVGGIASNDTTTWNNVVVETNVSSSKDIIKFKKVSNISIPTTYLGKSFVGVVIMMGTNKAQTINQETEQLFASPALIVGDSIDELKDYKNVVKYNTLDELDNRIAEAENSIQVLDNRIAEAENSIQVLDNRVSLIEGSEDDNLPKDIYLADIGSSFVNANHNGVDDIDENDPYMPIDGYSAVSTYKRKSHMYYIAKKYQLKWANYGFGGTTLVHCAPKAYPNRIFFPLVDERKEQLKVGIDWDYICITLGGNDIAFGPLYMRDLWLQETYGLDIGYPVNDSQIGAEGFATAEQKAACDAITGEVFGKNYEDNTLYFMAKFLGAKNSTDPNTYWGAWNIVLPYFMVKYKKAKIVIIDPLIAGYGERAIMMKEVIREVAKKWGVNFFDFNRLNWFYGQTTPSYSAFPNPNREDGKWELPNGTLFNGNVYGYILSRMSYDGQHPTNLGYQKLAGPIGHTIMNE